MDDSKKDTDLDWENRVLCSDESCIGVIRPDGRCSECGLPYQGELPRTQTSDARNDEEEVSGTDEGEPLPAAVDPEQTADDEPGDEPDDDEWARRELCRDESCIGVIGPDGRCKECGKS